MPSSAIGPALVLALPLLFLTSPVFAGDGDAIMHAVEKAMLSPGEHMAVRMEITAADGSTETRTLSMWIRHLEGRPSKTLIRFEGPATIAGTALLTIRPPGKAQDNWLYVPALDQVRRIAPQNRTESFVKSDFTVEDLSVVVDTKNRLYTLKGEEPCGERTCVVVEDTPANDRAARLSGYGRVVLRVDKETSLVTMVRFYDKSDALLKVLKSDGMIQVGDYHRWTSATIANVQTGTRTVMTVTDRPTGTVDDSVFSPSALEAW
jgi:outer membrane lipoprotein-sorting protein